MVAHHDTVIVGGGQAGLAMSYHLGQHDIEHVILERHRLAERWRSERWNSLRFQMPNWWISMPGMAFDAADPDDFASVDEVVAFLEAYASRIAAPLRTGVEVRALDRDEGGGYALETSGGPITARNVVIATGAYHRTRIPDFAASIPPAVGQLDAAGYRAPEALPDGAVLVVGSGASGSQIADELLRAGRRVYLSVGRHNAVPRRYRGRDMIWWLERFRRFDTPVDSLPGRIPPPPTVFTGADGGHDLSPRLLGLAGVTLGGRIAGFRDGAFRLCRTLNATLDQADDAMRAFLAAADAMAVTLSDEALDPAPPPPPPACLVEELETLDVDAEGIATVIWATGYAHDFHWVRLPLFDGTGAPVHRRGVTDWPGVYFLGLFWMTCFGSSTLPYVGRDAAYLATQIAGRYRRPLRA